MLDRGAHARILESTVSLGLEIRTISLQIRQSRPDYPGMPTRLSDLLVRRGLFVRFTWIYTVSWFGVCVDEVRWEQHLSWRDQCDVTLTGL
jgi:hypothetical protein